MATIPRYTGPFGTPQAERLLWRAGFGPRRGEAASLARLGLDGAVHSLTHPPGERWIGPAPHDDKGRPLAPADAWGHDHLWWLDRMVRTRRPLVERMTLVWHDWFATSNAGVGSQKLMLAQNRLLRRNALGRFDHLLVQITANPAMLVWLSGTDNRKGAPNENYGAGADGAVHPRRGKRVHREGRPRAGARAHRAGRALDAEQGPDQLPLRSDPARPGREDRVRQAGQLRLAGLCLALRPAPEARAVLRRQAVELLRARPTGCKDAGRPGSESTRSATSRCDPCSRRSSAIRRCTPARAWSIPPSCTSPGSCVGLGRGIDTTAWVWLAEGAGQRLFNPPNVAGWDDSRWLDTNTFHGRWWIANTALEKVSIGDRKGKKAPKVPNDPEAIVKGALAVLGNPTIGPETRRELLGSPVAR